MSSMLMICNDAYRPVWIVNSRQLLDILIKELEVKEKEDPSLSTPVLELVPELSVTSSLSGTCFYRCA